MTIAYRFLLRRGLAATLASVNEVPLEGEMVIETDTRKFKFGDGVTAWNSLTYASAVVPTVVSAFTNDAGYITSSALSGYLTSAAAAAAYQPLDSDLTAFAGKTAPSGAVVGTSDAQTLTNKDITATALTVEGATFPRIRLLRTGTAEWFIGNPTAGGTGNSFALTLNSTKKFELTSAGDVEIPLRTYADNAAAVSGGLTADMLYKTATGEVRIVV